MEGSVRINLLGEAHRGGAGEEEVIICVDTIVTQSLRRLGNVDEVTERRIH